MFPVYNKGIKLAAPLTFTLTVFVNPVGMAALGLKNSWTGFQISTFPLFIFVYIPTGHCFDAAKVPANPQ